MLPLRAVTILAADSGLGPKAKPSRVRPSQAASVGTAKQPLAAFDFSMHTAIDTGAATGVPIAIAGTLGFLVSGWNATGLPPFSIGYVNHPALAHLGLAASLTAPLRARLARNLSAKTLKMVFAMFLIIVGISMLWAAFRF